MNRIKLVPIDDEAFAPFGAVLAPHADGVRRDHFELLVNKRASARANLASVRADRRGGDAGMTVRTLERHRVAGTGPHFARLGRLIRYRRSDLDTWVQESLCTSTSDAPRPRVV